ncbi:MAG: hypothetical protein H6577_05215 [Lewinellaceae bacterium]|nr:hypothetical protein [Saprospiraceae bacterium]MCB9337504.1 hypothetical protein [Lewinellaceae bacterium]
MKTFLSGKFRRPYLGCFQKEHFQLCRFKNSVGVLASAWLLSIAPFAIGCQNKGPASQPAAPPTQQAVPPAKADPANFLPNSELEALLSDPAGQAGGLSAEVFSPKATYRWTLDEAGRTNLRFAGIIQHGPPGRTLRFNVLVFNNKDGATPLLTLPFTVAINPDGKAGYEVSQRAGLPQGLYYFKIENGEKKEMVAAGKFKITD